MWENGRLLLTELQMSWMCAAENLLSGISYSTNVFISSRATNENHLLTALKRKLFNIVRHINLLSLLHNWHCNYFEKCFYRF